MNCIVLFKFINFHYFIIAFTPTPNSSHINNNPPNAQLESNHANPKPSLQAIRRCSTSERNSGWARSRGVRRTGSIAASRKAKTVSHIEEDIDITVHAAE